jgi:uncharacterized protein YicC (UPF0701 family)
MRSRTVLATMAAVVALTACGGTEDTADIEGLTETAATAIEEGAEEAAEVLVPIAAALELSLESSQTLDELATDLDQAADEIRAEAPSRQPEGSTVLEDLADELEALGAEAANAEPTVDAEDLVARAIQKIEDALRELQASG